MQKTAVANLPLHHGKAPRWLFGRMVKLAGAVTEVIVDEFNQEEFLRRLSDPFWFQAFSCVLGFDWHSSGVTTTTCGALKEALKKQNIGLKVAGGKGKTSRKTPSEIENSGLSTEKIKRLIYASKISAKIDNSLIQDGYQLYHHCFIFTEKGSWCVVQQGMNASNRYARRYHWLSDGVKSFVNEPHNAICCDKKEKKVLDMTAEKSKETRETSIDLAREKPIHLKKYLETTQKTIFDFSNKKIKTLTMPTRHSLTERDLSKHVLRQLKKAYELQPENYEELVALKGIGQKSIRALALISELIYNKEPSWNEPSCITKFSFSHGGKDGWPEPVNKKTYDNSILTLKQAIENAKIGNKEKLHAIRRLRGFV